MFEILFTRPHAIARHSKGPLGEQRRRYLADCAERGMAIPTLWVLAHYLLTITKYLKLGKRGNEVISMAEVEAAADRWASRRHRPPKMQTKFFAQHHFLRHARRWLQFIGRLEQPVAGRSMRSFSGGCLGMWKNRQLRSVCWMRMAMARRFGRDVYF